MSDIDRVIQKYLSSHARRERAVGAARAVIFASAWMIFWTVAECLLDRTMTLARPATMTLAVIGPVVALAIARPVGALVRRRFDPVKIASDIEGRMPVFGGRLVTVASAPQSSSAGLLGQLKFETARNLTRLPPVTGELFKPAVTLIAAVILLGGLSMTPRMDVGRRVLRFVRPWRESPPVRITSLRLNAVPERVPAGTPVVFSCTATPVDPAPVALHVSDDGGTWSAWPMTADPAVAGKFVYDWPALNRDLRYYITAGDAVSGTLSIHRSPRPPARPKQGAAARPDEAVKLYLDQLHRASK